MRILLVDDSALARGILKVGLEQAGFQVVGLASNGQTGYELARDLVPDVVIMDINMPVMDGLTATQKIMSDCPVPIIVFSSQLDGPASFSAIANGAIDIMHKPSIAEYNNPAFIEEFRKKIIAASEAKRIFFSGSGVSSPGRAVSAHDRAGTIGLVVMGASTGGPVAVSEILAALGPELGSGIVLVQHLECGFDASYAEWLQGQTRLKVSLASEGPVPGPGCVMIAPVGVHTVISGNSIQLEDSDPLFNQKPAVDKLFSSAAAMYGSRLLGILLTGMGSDGAAGCADIIRCGGYTLVQNKETASVFGMPKAAIELQAASEVLSLSDIPARIRTLCGGFPL